MSRASASCPAVRSLAWSCALLLLAWAPLSAQTSTGIVRGFVRGEAGQPVALAEVVATHTATNATRSTVTTQQGFYNLAGLQPGDYELRVRSLSYADQTRAVRVQIGQTLSVDFDLTVQAIELGGIQVQAERVVEKTTPEVATNITQEQIESVPLNDRNFLALATLAPGVRRSGGSITSGGQSANNINVFVDGVSYKSDILTGGVAGQDASRGNPFPQVAVQEFRVITQQYKAEYQKATSAVITATTKSGTNEWTGSAFGHWQGKDVIEQDILALDRGDAKPDLRKWQFGGDVGGPLVRDRLFFFGAYEGNHQNRAASVSLGPRAAEAPAALVDQLRAYEGTFTAPFRSNLYFGKVTYAPAEEHRLEASVNVRDEYDIRSFGNRDSYDNAEHFFNDVKTFLVKHQYAKGSWLNDAKVSYQWFNWHPVPLRQELVGLNYDGVLKIGGRSTMQDFTQKRWSLRNDVSYTLAGLGGDHAFKVGGNIDFLDYDIIQPLDGVPQFIFRASNNWAFPVEAVAGFGDPDFSADNRQIGLYAQDDWALTPRLQLNLGVRWDYESNMINTDYVTPDSIRREVLDFVETLPCDGSDPKREQLCDPTPYLTDGDDRDPFYGAIQPRLGFSYDLFGDGRTVAFGGWGLYYDRNRYGEILGEASRHQWLRYTFRFSSDGAPQGTNPTIIWDDQYLSREGLRSLVGTFNSPRVELFLTENETRPPKTQQFSLGVRQSFGDYLISTNYTGVRGHNIFTWIRANRNPNGSCCNQLPHFSNVFVSSDDARSWYDAMYLKVEKRYTEASRYGWQLSYTLAWADEEAIPGGVFSALDVFTPDDFVRYPSANDERHHVTANWILGLPFQVKLSGVLDLGSGTPRNATVGFGPGTNACTHGNMDCLGGDLPPGETRNWWAPPKQSFIIPDAWAYRNVDLRLEKDFTTIRGQRVGLIAEVFNVFNHTNYTGYDTRFGDFRPDNSIEPNPNFGTPNGVITGLGLSFDPGAPRRFQFGARYAF